MSLLDALNFSPSSANYLAPTLLSRLFKFLLRWEAFDEALAVLQAVGMDGLSGRYDLLAQAQSGTGDHQAALVTMKSRLALSDPPSAVTLRAQIMLAAGDATGADEVLQPVLAGGGTQTAWVVHGQIRLAQHDPAGAEAAFLHLQKLAALSRNAAIGLAECQFAQGHAVQATAYAMQAIALEAGRFAPGVGLLRQARSLCERLGETARVAEIDEQLAERFADELAALQPLLASAGRAPEKPRPPQAATSAPVAIAAPTPTSPISAVTDLNQVAISAAERAELVAAAQRLFGFNELLPAQGEIIQRVRSNEHVLAILPTGAGKSLCYQLPALMDPGLTLVISPLIALMKDQVDGLPAAVRDQAIAINSSMDGKELRAATEALKARRFKLVYAAPERLRQPSFLHAVREAGLTRLVIDEAHCISVWGHDFRPDYLSIAQVHRDLGSPPILAMTATAPPVVRDDIRQRLFAACSDDRPLQTIAADTFRPNLLLSAQQLSDENDRREFLQQLAPRLAGSGIIYAPSRARCELLADMLRSAGVAAAHYHAGMNNRSQAQDDFMTGKTRVVVATIAFGMGIDKPDIRFIIHYGPPRSVEGYYQEAGRAGRDGLPAQCVLLYTSADRSTMSRHANEGVIPIELLRRVYTAVSRRLRERNPGAVRVAEVAAELECDDTSLRVAISSLEQTGLLQRFHDLPSSITLRINRREGPVGELANFARLPLGSYVTRATYELADWLGAPLAEMEPQLLAWQSAGLLEYQPVGRDLLIAQPPAPVDSAVRIQSLLSQYAALQRQRVADIWGYAQTSRCRHGQLAAYLGGAPRARCDACDNCVDKPSKKRRAPAVINSADKQVVLAALASGGWGRRNLARLLAGDPDAPARAQANSAYGALRHRTESALRKLVEAVIDDGSVEEFALNTGFRALRLTPKGQRSARGQK